MIAFLSLVLLLGGVIQESQPAVSQARLIGLHDLPRDLALPFRENGFTVVTVAFVNKSAETVTIDTAKIRVLDPKNKPLVAASSSEVTPKMVKSGTRGPNLHAGGTGGVYRPGYGRPIDPGVTVGSGSGGGVIDLGRVQRLKETIEKYQLKTADVPAGGTLEGYLYLKTDEDPDKLKGTRILLTEEITLTVE